MAVVAPHRDTGSPPTWDALFEVLSSSHRRHLLSLLVDEREVAVSRLVDRIASTREECSAESLTAEQTTPVRTSLHHAHLPALEAAGLVAWDRRERTVTLAEGAADLPIFRPLENSLVSLRGGVEEVKTDV